MHFSLLICGLFQIREKKIYVGGIPDDYTPSELKEKFKHFGEITKVSVHPQTEQ